MKLLLWIGVLPALVSAARGGERRTHRRSERGHRLHKRVSGQATFFNVEENEVACGGFYSNSDYVVALNQAMFGNLNARSQYCNQQVTISYGGKSHSAKIVDACPAPGCQYGALDMSPSLFNFFENPDAGVFQMSWSFGGGGGGDDGGDSSPTTSSPNYVATTTSYVTPILTPTPTPTPSSSQAIIQVSLIVPSSSAVSSAANATVSLVPVVAGNPSPNSPVVGNLAANGQIVVALGRLLALSAQQS